MTTIAIVGGGVLFLVVIFFAAIGLAKGKGEAAAETKQLEKSVGQKNAQLKAAADARPGDGANDLDSGTF